MNEFTNICLFLSVIPQNCCGEECTAAILERFPHVVSLQRINGESPERWEWLSEHTTDGSVLFYRATGMDNFAFQDEDTATLFKLSCS